MSGYTPSEEEVRERYCPAFGPGSRVCHESICDCFIAQFPDDMKQAGALHPEFFQVTYEKGASDDQS